jgi:hypothetical protein
VVGFLWAEVVLCGWPKRKLAEQSKFQEVV